MCLKWRKKKYHSNILQYVQKKLWLHVTHLGFGMRWFPHTDILPASVLYIHLRRSEVFIVLANKEFNINKWKDSITQQNNTWNCHKTKNETDTYIWRSYFCLLACQSDTN